MPGAKGAWLARGRVSTGLQAEATCIVDGLGGLDTAIALAKKRAGIAADADVDVVNYPARKTLFEMLAERFSGANSQADMSLELRMAAALFGSGDRQTLGMLTAPMRPFNRGEPLALMPFHSAR